MLKRIAALLSCMFFVIIFLGMDSHLEADPIQGVSPRTQFFLGTALRSFFSSTHLERGDRELRVNAVVLAGSYALSTDATLTFVVPHLDKEMELPDGSSLRSTGIGDSRLLAKWTFLRIDSPGSRTQAAIFGGLELPTGSDSEKDNGVLLPPRLQPGSGSLDTVLGAALGRSRPRYDVEGGVQWKINSEANDFRFGNEFNYDIAFEYHLYPSFPTKNFSQIIMLLEFNGSHTGKDSLGSREMGNTGGDVIFISPGLQYILTGNLLIEASLQIPILQDLNEDPAAGPDPLRFKHSVLFGFRYIF